MDGPHPSQCPKCFVLLAYMKLEVLKLGRGAHGILFSAFTHIHAEKPLPTYNFKQVDVHHRHHIDN